MKHAALYPIVALLGLLSLTGCRTQEYVVHGPEGGIAFEVTLPEGFDTTTDRCPLVILMHGIFSSKDSASTSTDRGRAKVANRT